MVLTGKNLTDFRWAHAVNTKKQLDYALLCNIQMIEADVLLGKLNNEGDDVPIMAHPPRLTSDLSLVEFLNKIKQHNDCSANTIRTVKLDFKSIEVFEGSFKILDEMYPEVSYTIWLNADILQGPLYATHVTPVDPERFFAGCMRYKNAILSIGWTTRWNTILNRAPYTTDQISEMLSVLKKYNILQSGHAITFPVRAGIAANSEHDLSRLLNTVQRTNDCTLTIWSSEGDYVDVKRLREIIFSIGVEKIYLDVPDHLLTQLQLNRTGLSIGPTCSSLITFTFVSACFWAFSSWLQSAI